MGVCIAQVFQRMQQVQILLGGGVFGREWASETMVGRDTSEDPWKMQNAN